MRPFLLLHIVALFAVTLPLACELFVLSALNPTTGGSAPQQTVDSLSAFHDWLASNGGYFTHRGKEDSSIDYGHCRLAFTVSGLKEYGLSPDVLAAFIRCEQRFYVFFDDQQDAVLRQAGQQWREMLRCKPTTSVGPAQLQIHNIYRLVCANNADGTAKHPSLVHLRQSSWKEILRCRNSALLLGALLQEEAGKLKARNVPVNGATLAYVLNPDVLKRAGQDYYVSPDLIDRNLIRAFMPDRWHGVGAECLTPANWKAVTSVSRHSRNVREQLRIVLARGVEKDESVTAMCCAKAQSQDRR